MQSQNLKSCLQAIALYEFKIRLARNYTKEQICTDSMGCIAFALWLGILPEDERQAAADRLNALVIESDYRFTTGNLTTRYLYDVLTEYGYVDTAWELISREEYPSIGYMIQHEATTVWERFEFKTDTEMNSMNHPMYGSLSYWFYAGIMGLNPEEAGWTGIRIKPSFPKKLHSAEAQLDTPMGKIHVRWIRRNGVIHLYAQIPFGAEARVAFLNLEERVSSGFYHWEKVVEL